MIHLRAKKPARVPAFISSTPRPYILPSFILPLTGSLNTFHFPSPMGIVSICPEKRRDLFPLRPGNLTTRFGLLLYCFSMPAIVGKKSGCFLIPGISFISNISISFWGINFETISYRYSWPGFSLPEGGRFSVLILTKSERELIIVSLFFSNHSFIVVRLTIRTAPLNYSSIIITLHGRPVVFSIFNGQIYSLTLYFVIFSIFTSGPTRYMLFP